MKILEIVFHLAPGGVERFVVDLSNEMAKTNDVTLLVLRDQSIDNGFGSFYNDDISDKVDFKCLGLQPGLSIKDWWKIYRSINRISPDIVHFHGEGMPYWMFVPIIFASRKIKFFQTIHSDIHNRYDRGIYKKLYIPLFVNSGRVKMISLSPSNYKELLSIYPNANATCIVNGRAEMSQTDNYEEVKKEVGNFRKTSKTRVFLHVGRCSKEKNQKRLIRAFNKMVENGFDAQLIIIGSGFDNDLGLELRNMACNDIHFIGTRKNISDYQICSDIFCLSSDYEGMPITLVEALLSGTPVLSTPVCGALDAIESYNNGFISEDFSDEKYYEAMKLAYNNYETISSHAFQQKDSCPFTIKCCADKYLNYFAN